jgi:hypothetical protein
VTLLGDPSNVDAVVPHNIILCDVQGVGHSLDSKKQGAFLIREIKAHFPDKYVIAYTGGSSRAHRPAHQVPSRWRYPLRSFRRENRSAATP